MHAGASTELCIVQCVWGEGSSPGRVEGSSRAMLATARPSCYLCYACLIYFTYMKPTACYIVDGVSVDGTCTGYSAWTHTTFKVWLLWVCYTLSMWGNEELWQSLPCYRGRWRVLCVDWINMVCWWVLNSSFIFVMICFYMVISLKGDYIVICYITVLLHFCNLCHN